MDIWNEERQDWDWITHQADLNGPDGGTAILSTIELEPGATYRFRALAEGPGTTKAARILWYVRLPRTGACLLAGAGLAVSGAVIQKVLANNLASPGIIGINAGAGLAVAACCAVALAQGALLLF